VPSLLFDWVLPLMVVLLLCTLMIAVSGCSTTSDRARSLDLAVKGSYSPGPDASTRNQIPQGGTDEKSDSTPREPAN
jgi:hypothetical protein